MKLNLLKPAARELMAEEWLITNGLGGYGSSTILGGHTRRYHGLLCMAQNPPTDRQMIVSHMVEKLEYKDKTYPLSTEIYVGSEKPYNDYLNHFSRFPYPVWEYGNKQWKCVKSITMRPGKNTTIVSYKNTGESKFKLHLNPLLVMRDHHYLTHKHDGFSVRVMSKTTLKVNDLCIINSSLGQWEVNPDWYYNFFYAEEAARGFESTEEAFTPGKLVINLTPGETVFVTLTTEKTVKKNPKTVFKEVEDHYKAIPESKKCPWYREAVFSSQQFIVDRASTRSKTVIAGYPWFMDWSRDTLISLRFLMPHLGQKEVQGILKGFLDSAKEGLLPNRFPDRTGEALEYNTADGTLWFFVALWYYYREFKDITFVNKIFPQLTEILGYHVSGTHHNIGITSEGLIFAAHSGQQLTWMDAKVGDFVVTPRAGCPVEINCLWYNALKIYQFLSKEVGANNKLHFDVGSWISKFEHHFEPTFWNVCGDYLNDVFVPGKGWDESVRPNQIYSVSLPFSPLSKQQQENVLLKVYETCYTSLGLRTLAPDDPNFIPEYKGDSFERDRAYHQGTVWPFLLADYWVAHENLFGLKHTQARLTEEVKPLLEHFYEDGCIGGVSEVFDGLKPKEGKGCINQAWSVAALLCMGQILQKK